MTDLFPVALIQVPAEAGLVVHFTKLAETSADAISGSPFFTVELESVSPDLFALLLLLLQELVRISRTEMQKLAFTIFFIILFFA